jgi:hypothetical protein
MVCPARLAARAERGVRPLRGLRRRVETRDRDPRASRPALHGGIVRVQEADTNGVDRSRRYPENIEENAPIGSGRRGLIVALLTAGSTS